MGNRQSLTFYINNITLYVMFYENALFISINKFTIKVIKETKNIVFLVYSKVIHIYIYTYIFFFIFFYIMDYHRILYILPYNLVVYFCI